MTTAKVAGTKIAGVLVKKGKKLTCPKSGVKRKIGTKTYTVKGNHKLKSVATKSAAAAKKQGKLARIVKSATCGYTVLTATPKGGIKKTKAKTAAKAKCTCHKKTKAKRTYTRRAKSDPARGMAR